MIIQILESSSFSTTSGFLFSVPIVCCSSDSFLTTEWVDLLLHETKLNNCVDDHSSVPVLVCIIKFVNFDMIDLLAANYCNQE